MARVVDTTPFYADYGLPITDDGQSPQTAPAGHVNFIPLERFHAFAEGDPAEGANAWGEGLSEEEHLC